MKSQMLLLHLEKHFEMVRCKAMALSDCYSVDLPRNQGLRGE